MNLISDVVDYTYPRNWEKLESIVESGIRNTVCSDDPEFKTACKVYTNISNEMNRIKEQSKGLVMQFSLFDKVYFLGEIDENNTFAVYSAIETKEESEAILELLNQIVQNLIVETLKVEESL